jgi:hypothetical protein
MSAFNECGGVGKPNCLNYTNMYSSVSIDMTEPLTDRVNIAPGYNYINLSRSFVKAGTIPTLRTSSNLAIPGTELLYESNEAAYSDGLCVLSIFTNSYLTCSSIVSFGKKVKMSVRFIMDYEQTYVLSGQYAHVGVYNLTANVNDNSSLLPSANATILVNELPMFIEPIVSGNSIYMLIAIDIVFFLFIYTFSNINIVNFSCSPDSLFEKQPISCTIRFIIRNNIEYIPLLIDYGDETTAVRDYHVKGHF